MFKKGDKVVVKDTPSNEELAGIEGIVELVQEPVVFLDLGKPFTRPVAFDINDIELTKGE